MFEQELTKINKNGGNIDENEFDRIQRWITIMTVVVFSLAIVFILSAFIAALIIGPEVWAMIRYLVYGR